MRLAASTRERAVEHNFHASEGLIGGGDEKRGRKLDRQGVVAEDPCLFDASKSF